MEPFLQRDGDLFLDGPILVTGASGVLGRAVVAALSDAGIVVRQAVRSPEKAKPGLEFCRLRRSSKVPAFSDTVNSPSRTAGETVDYDELLLEDPEEEKS
jgi:nucleoside-diphosphate-sugar epimerase